MANFLEVSQRTYSNFESNKSEPSLTQLSKLAEILEFNLLDMLQEQGVVFNNQTSSDKARIKDLEEINNLLREKIIQLERYKKI